VSVLATLDSERRALIFTELALRLSLPPFIVEKDFWVCWLLARIFESPDLGTACVFKGGTSLSKVFGVLKRFSEDVDLSISPACLGWEEVELEDAPSTSMRQKRMKAMETDCARAVRERFGPELETTVDRLLGAPPDGGQWLTYASDPASHSPTLRFAYPPAVSAGSYIAPIVKMEFGSLTDQRPTGRHTVTAMLEQVAPGLFRDTRTRVVALELERSFWEKATILHAEHHRPADRAIPARMARHYADFAALWCHPSGRAAAQRLDLLERVRRHKSRFFSSAWANYENAVPGTLRLLPTEQRLPELRQDYRMMEPMFLVLPPDFDALLQVISDAEATLNATGQDASMVDSRL